MESTLKSSQSVASSVTSDSETETWEVIDDKQKKNSDDEKEEKQQENKQENPKITIDKAESVERLSSDDNDDTSQTKTDVDACQECASTENESSLNVRRASHGNRIEDEFSDGISVISESELECNETHSDYQPLIETMDHHPKKDLILKSSSEMVAVPAKKSCILTCLKELFANNQFATVAILSILVAILGGIFCQLSMILNGSQIPLSTTTNDFNLLVCQNKITELEGENANLKIEVTILQQQIEKLQNDLNLIKLGQVQGDQLKVQAQQSGSRTKVQGKGKKVKTKYDQFKRPPVAAGGEEETIIHVDKSQIHEELQEDPSWKEYLEPIKSLWDDETPLDINEILNEEPSTPDLNDFEPIQPIEIPNEATPQDTLQGTDLDSNKNMKNEAHERKELNENDNKFPEHDNQERKFDKNKSKKYNENVKKNKKYDQNERKNNQKDEKIQSHEDSSGNSEVKNNKNENKRQKRRDGSGSNEKYDQNDHKKYRKESENNHSGERKYQNNDKRQKKREGSGSNERYDKGKNDNNEKYYKNKENRENSGDSDEDFKYNEKKLRKQSAFDDSSNENERDTKREFSGNNNKEKRKQQKKKNYDENRPKYINENDSDEKSDKNWHEDRMKNREKYRNQEKEENWYIERKQNREKHREERDKDSNWYMERNLERELLRSREMNSKEKSK